MKRRDTVHPILALLVTAAIATPVMADDDAEPRKDSAWNIRIEQDQSKQGEETSETMRIRVFDDVDRLPPDEFAGQRRPGIAVDVEAEMITCPDGNTRVEKVTVGGKEFDVDSECERARRGSKITVDGSTTRIETEGRSAKTAEE
ncbi:MAG: hypothetical protein HKN81_03515 [Gammaproteobacteria bacterium]|nr:hypothetical protein [Gammaproteobacteria bacterium]